MNTLEGLEPRALWARFDAIRRIPRPSKKEERIRAHVLDFAAAHGLETAVDSGGNCVVRVPASPGLEAAPTVVLQGHLDMVCVQEPGRGFDFDHDPIGLRLDGDLLRADGTTLGADNGVAVAAGLALVTDRSTRHGPLELLFTVDEETGLNGVKELDPSLVTGRILLNLDSEEEGVLTIGCAGAGGVIVEVTVDRLHASSELPLLHLAVRGGTGGHSGMDIAKGRANALHLLGETLAALDGAELVSFSGGVTRNALAGTADALVRAEPAAARAACAAAEQRFRERHRQTDPALRISCEEAPSEAENGLGAMTVDSAARLLKLVAALPHGVLAMSEALPGQVETSANLAVAQTRPRTVEIEISCRSVVDEGLARAAEAASRAAREHGAVPRTVGGYPGWTPDPDSPLLAKAVTTYRRLYGTDPAVGTVHAGLECGLIGRKIPGMDMLSFGPDIRNPHSPHEQVSVSSVQRVLGEYLPALLEALAEA